MVRWSCELWENVEEFLCDDTPLREEIIERQTQEQAAAFCRENWPVTELSVLSIIPEEIHFEGK